MNNYKKLSKESMAIILLTVGGILLRLVYVIRIPYYVNQHDAGNFTSGHIGYICYLLEHNWRLPDFNPTTVWSFYHPPLHHYLAAFFAKLNMLFGLSLEQSLENVQLLTVFYGFLILLVSFKLLKKFQLKGMALVLPYALLAFHPSLIILSGSINNDGLCLLFMLVTIYAAVCWYEKPDKKHITILALLFAATVLTKLSGLLLAPAVGIVFLVKLLKEKKQAKSLLAQFILFAVICIPLSLSYSIRNLILWHVNPFFTLTLGDYMYTGNNLLERVFLLHKEQFASPFVIYNVTPSNMLAVDRNIIFYLLKTSLYGDKFFLAADSPYITLAWALHLVNFLLILTALVCMIAELVLTGIAVVKEKQLSIYIKEFFLFLLYGCSIGSFILFCFKYPNACSQDFRYIQLALPVHMVFLGLFLRRTKCKKGILKNILYIGLILLSVLFILFTSILFFNCAKS